MILLQTCNRQPIPILVYHQIINAPPKGSPFRSLYVSPAAFARQMGLLKLLGYTGLSIGQLAPYLNGERSGKVIGITFDDGYQNNLTNAMPILNRYGFSSTVYAVSGLLGKTNVWDASIGIPQVPLMNASELQQWVAGGQEVGSHTLTHANLLATDDETARREITHGKRLMDTATGVSTAQFCYPYGRYANVHAAIAREAGFETATTTLRGRCHAATDLFQLPRVMVVRSTTLPVFWLKIATAYEDLRGKRTLMRQAQIELQRTEVPSCALRS